MIGQGRFSTCYMATRTASPCCEMTPGVAPARFGGDETGAGGVAEADASGFAAAGDNTGAAWANRAPVEPACDASPVVMKLIKPERGRIDLAAVAAECEALARLDHPGVPKLLGIVNAAWEDLLVDRGPGLAKPGSSAAQNLDSGQAGESSAADGASSCIAQGSCRTPVSSRPVVPRSPLRPAPPYFIVEECMPGLSLYRMLTQGKRVFSDAEVAAIGSALIGILEHVEAREVVHGDVGPANVLLDGNRVSLIDFGLAALGGQGHGTLSAEERSRDYRGLADVLLFLLYSDKRRMKTAAPRDSSWREELNLTAEQMRFLEALFAGQPHFENFAEVERRFKSAFSPCS